MGPSTTQMTQRRPKGFPYGVDDDWRMRVDARLLELKIAKKSPSNRSELAKAAAVSTAAMSQLFQQNSDGEYKQKTCRYKPEIHRALGWPAPSKGEDGGVPKNIDESVTTVLNALDVLDESARKALAVMAAELMKGKR